jgi:hypothetical protein
MSKTFESWKAHHLACITGKADYAEPLPVQESFPFRLLDFSKESLADIDAYLLESAIALKSSTTSYASWENLAVGLGFYLGQVYQRLAPIPQRWLDPEELLRECPWWRARMTSALPWRGALLMDSGRITWPFHLAVAILDHAPRRYGAREAMREMCEGGAGRQMRGHPTWETCTARDVRLAHDIRGLYARLPALLGAFAYAPVELRLNFTLESIDALDAIIDELIASGQMPYDVAQIDRLLLPLTAYVGETIRRRSLRAYRWADHQDVFPEGGPPFTISSALVLYDDERKTCLIPGARVYDRLYANLASTLSHLVRWECPRV